MAFFTILVLIAVGLWLYKVCTPSQKIRKYGNLIPGQKPYPLIGNAHLFLQNKPRFKVINEQNEKFGPITRFWIGKQLFILLADADDIEMFLTSNVHLNKTDTYRLLDSWLGNKGLLTSDVDIWRVHRKLLTPSFHFRILEDAVNIISSNAEVLCQQLASKVDESEFDIGNYVERCSLDIICESAMGVKIETQVSKNAKYIDSLKILESSAITRAFYVWLHPEFAFRLSQTGREYYKALKLVKEAGWKVIDRRRKFLAENFQKEEEVNEDGLRKKPVKPFLDSLLTAGTLSDEEIENEVQTFMFAGHDTTTSSISFSLYLLSQYPDVQTKLLNEIRDMFSESPKPTMQDYVNMKYMDCFVKESLRYYSAVPVVSRKVEQDIRLPSGYLLPAGTQVNFNIFHLHRREKYFPNADQFLPERFQIRDNGHHFAYIPFSAGPRNCIGQKFALLEIKIVLSIFLLTYEILPADITKELILENKTVLSSLNGIPIRITKRQS